MQKENHIETNAAILPISVIASTLNVHQRTLRIYDSAQILSPKRTQKNRRKYSLNDLKKCELILFLTRNLAMNLMGAKLFLHLFDKYDINIKELNKLALKIGISKQIQKENIIKNSNKGRKPKGNNKKAGK